MRLDFKSRDKFLVVLAETALAKNLDFCRFHLQSHM